MIDREPFASATKTRHHFISNQHDAVLVAKIAQALHVSIWRNQYAVCADYRFDDDCCHGLWTLKFENFFSAREHVFRCIPTLLNTMIEIRNAKDTRDAGFGGPTTRIARERPRT